ncbi:hypothetical protein [Salipiger sp. 1_MG-2023]|uniref:hypothetical protein n=1 Tax=Salipiger sp. 1_MG-2023 TaxID=3062665 RepID=UPI0026E3C5C0|nr:hypothetical protein [Salipiger sp. 1_MG-2023]
MDSQSGSFADRVPQQCLERLTSLVFIKRLDDLHTAHGRVAEDLGRPMARRIFQESTDDKGDPYDNLRWCRFQHFETCGLMRLVDEHVFPLLRQIGEAGSFCGTHMMDARPGFSNANLRAKAVQILNDLPMEDRDNKGDVVPRA